MDVTSVHWHLVADALPDVDQTVLVAISDEALESMYGPHEPVVAAWYDGEIWLEHATGGQINHAFTHWCDLPDRPL